MTVSSGARPARGTLLVLIAALGLTTVSSQAPTTPGRDAARPAAVAAAPAHVAPIATPVVTAATTPDRPCDLLAASGTPCVAAHSTTRALFVGYTGRLYQVRRVSDGAVADVHAAPSSGLADPTPQRLLCARSPCVISVIYDQTTRHNDLTVEPAGTNGGADHGVPADALPVTAAGHPVFGASFSGKMGYRHRAGAGVAVHGQPEGIYLVTSGTHVNSNCCFDYGNAERAVADTGNGHMDAIYIGCRSRSCAGGPFVAADLENGLFQTNRGLDPSRPGPAVTSPFVVAMVHTDGRRTFAVKDGDARTGALITRFAGNLPTNRPGYAPLHQEGSIVLGTGGDNSNLAVGSFFEGAMTAGTPSESAENAVAADVAAVHYGSP